jgi:hypothetical protein
VTFCPVCGVVDRPIELRCERVGRYYGYTPEDLAALQARGSSIAVPFFEVKRLFYVLQTLVQHPLARAMVQAVEQGQGLGTVEEHGNLVRVMPFQSPLHPEVRELYVKEDVSKNMVVYQPDDAIEHFGSEERAVLFAELAHGFFGLGAAVPAVAMGLTPAGAKFVVSAGLPRDQFGALGESDEPRLRALWHQGTLPRLALMDVILGQKDRNAGNVLLPLAPGASGIGLVDNDDTFGPQERLIEPLAYLAPLQNDPSLRLGGASAWFAGLHLPRLLARLSPLALPPEILAALCGRFVYAAEAVRTDMSLQRFVADVFSRRVARDEALPGRPYMAYRALVSERRDGVHQRHLLAAQRGAAVDAWVLEGRALDPAAVSVRTVQVSGVDEAEEVIGALESGGAADGFTQLPRRRLFVDGETLRILEVRADAAGWHLVIRRGRLGHYADKLVERFVSFATAAEAACRADELEAELLAAGSSDLRARLTAFRASGERVQIF